MWWLLCRWWSQLVTAGHSFWICLCLGIRKGHILWERESGNGSSHDFLRGALPKSSCWDEERPRYISHDGSMVLLYTVTWIPSIYPLYVSINIPAPWILWISSCFAPTCWEHTERFCRPEIPWVTEDWQISRLTFERVSLFFKNNTGYPSLNKTLVEREKSSQACRWGSRIQGFWPNFDTKPWSWINKLNIRTWSHMWVYTRTGVDPQLPFFMFFLMKDWVWGLNLVFFSHTCICCWLVGSCPTSDYDPKWCVDIYTMFVY